ncbi:MAG: hypothetical protein WAK31_01990 [Chthoniobacterales bacterium]
MRNLAIGLIYCALAGCIEPQRRTAVYNPAELVPYSKAGNSPEDPPIVHGLIREAKKVAVSGGSKIETFKRTRGGRRNRLNRCQAENDPLTVLRTSDSVGANARTEA